MKQTQRYLILVLCGVALVGAVILIARPVTQAARSLTFTEDMLAEAELQTMALQVARTSGLTDPVLRTETALMPYGAFLTMINADAGSGTAAGQRDAALFVAKFQGKISKLSMYGVDDRDTLTYDTLIVSIDPRTGALFQVGAYPVGAASPEISRWGTEGF